MDKRTCMCCTEHPFSVSLFIFILQFYNCSFDFIFKFQNEVLLVMDKRHVLQGTPIWYWVHATLKRYNERGCRRETCCDTERYSLQPVTLAIADCGRIV